MEEQDLTQEQDKELQMIIEHLANPQHDFQVENSKNLIYDSSGDNKLDATVRINDDYVNVSTLIEPINITNVYVKSIKHVTIEGKTDDGLRFRLRFKGGYDF